MQHGGRASRPSPPPDVHANPDLTCLEAAIDARTQLGILRSVGVRPNTGLVDWRVTQQRFMPLSVAAAIAFHQAQRRIKWIQSPYDYMEALNRAATGLSRLIPIYVMDEGLRMRVTIDVDLLRGEFSGGATEYLCQDGSTLGPLSVVRGDLASALSFMRQVGPSFAVGEEAGAGA